MSPDDQPQSSDIEKLDGKVEKLDEKVDGLAVKAAILDQRLKIGFAILAVLDASPKFGGPSAIDAVSAFISLL